MFAALEKPMAYATFVTAFLVLLWKSPIGIEWIPGTYVYCSISVARDGLIALRGWLELE